MEWEANGFKRLVNKGIKPKLLVWHEWGEQLFSQLDSSNIALWFGAWHYE